MAKHDNKWTFLTNHAHVILVLINNSRLTLREVAEQVGITERAVQRIVAELEEDGYLSKQREGRNNRYIIHHKKQLRHPIEAHCVLGDLANMIMEK